MSHASRSRGGQPPDLPDDSAALPADPVPDVPDVPEAPPTPSPRRPSRHGRRLVPAWKANASCSSRVAPPRRLRYPRAMKQSTARFLTTHTGSLPRPDDLIRTMFAKEEGVPVDGAALAARVRAAVVRAAGRRGTAVRAAGPAVGWGPQARGERDAVLRRPRRAYD